MNFLRRKFDQLLPSDTKPSQTQVRDSGPPLLALLPAELKLEIFSYLKRIDLSYVTMTNKHIRVAYLELLYRKIDLTWQSHRVDLEKEVEVTPHFPRADLLLRTVIRNPGRAMWIEELGLEIYGARPKLAHALGKPSRKVLMKDTEQFVTAMRGITLPPLNQWKSWEEGLRKNDFDAVIALLIMKCTRLTSLSIEWDIFFQNSFLNQAIQQGIGGGDIVQAGLNGLRMLRLSGRLEEHTYGDDTVMGMFPRHALLALTAFEVVVPHKARKMLGSREFKSATDAVTSLRFPDSLTSPEMIRSILATTPKLTRFEYDHKCYMPKEGLGETLAAGLNQVKGTLTYLKLAASPWGPTYGPDPQMRFSEACDLRNLESLVTLDIQMAVLLGWRLNQAPHMQEVLPGGLRDLIIRDAFRTDWYAMHILEHLQKFFDDRQQENTTPKLKSVSLVLHHNSGNHGWDNGVHENFANLCDANGLKWHVIKEE